MIQHQLNQFRFLILRPFSAEFIVDVPDQVVRKDIRHQTFGCTKLFRILYRVQRRIMIRTILFVSGSWRKRAFSSATCNFSLGCCRASRNCSWRWAMSGSGNCFKNSSRSATHTGGEYLVKSVESGRLSSTSFCAFSTSLSFT